MEQFEKYVYKIYEERSFSAAARALFVSQPSLSARVARLEKEREADPSDDENGN